MSGVKGRWRVDLLEVYCITVAEWILPTANYRVVVHSHPSSVNARATHALSDRLDDVHPSVTCQFLVLDPVQSWSGRRKE
jgi:hypothetical protein